MRIRRKQREKRTHAVRWGLLVCAAALCLVSYAGVRGVVRMADDWIADLRPVTDVDFASTSRESTMYASDGSTVLAEFQLEKRDPVTLDDISPYVLDATVDTEDVRFYSHNGVDPRGIARAALNNLRGGSLEGASTITQQLVRNTVLTQEAGDISFKRKVREAELAIKLEEAYSKDEILLMYLNTINYGDGCYGIEAAAQNYFQTTASDLSLAQAATLAGIPQSPAYLNPKEHPEKCLARRNVVLDRMLSTGHIDQEEHDRAQAEELGLNPAPDAPADGIYAHPYFASYVRDLLLDEDNPYGCSYADLFQGGLSIYTTLDVDLQRQAEQACADQAARMDASLDTALVAVDPANGHAKALVGGKDYGESQVNVATGDGGSGRQAGSTFKAFTLAAAIEAGISPDTPVDCRSPLTVKQDGEQMSFENFGGANYGVRSIESATAVSSNTGYLRLSEALGQEKTTEMAARLGVSAPMEPVYTATLGVADVTPLDLASAYATLASGGVKHPTVAVVKIVDRNGTVVYEAPDEGERVLDERVAGATTDALRSVFASGGTAAGAAPSNGQPVAGKTGTSSDFADHWLVGYTPYLACAAWIGDPRGSVRTDESLNCNLLWSDFMNAATAGRAVEPFPAVEKPTYDNPYNAEQKAKLGVNDEAGTRDGDEDGDARDPDRDSEEADEDASGDEGVPNTVGATFWEAVELLNDYEAGYREAYSDSVPEGTVISQSVEDGMVVIVVSLGPEP